MSTSQARDQNLENQEVKQTATESKSKEVVHGLVGQKIDNYLQSMVKAGFRGAVLVKKDGELVLSKGYGYAKGTGDAIGAFRNTPSTVFQIASLTKQFTAAAIMKLQEAGKLDIGQPINNYLPEKYQFEVWDDVTVLDLLSHTSGIPNYTDADNYSDIAKTLTVDKIIRQAAKKKLLFQPGDDYNYCNTEYTILGVIIEELSGQSYADFIKKELFIPAGMTSSGVRTDTCVPADNAAIGYCWNDSNTKLIEDTSENIAATCADGAIFSTVEDLAKWSDVLDGKKGVLSKKSIETMTDPGWGNYGCGLFIDKAFKRKRIHHNGSIAGFRTDFCKFPDEDATIIALSNTTFFCADCVTYDISKILFKPNEEVPLVIPFPGNLAESPFIGEFESDELGPVRIVADGYHLCLIDDDDEKSNCYLLSNHRLFEPSEGMEFKLENNGDISVYQFDEGKKYDTLVRPDTGWFSNIMNWFSRKM
jgi:CubicO group peptidase (beta-lactamase class C family)